MPAITVKNIPNKLYQKLKKRAAKNRRSVNSEIIRCLETTLENRPLNVKDFLLEVEDLRSSTKAPVLTADILRVAKQAGRP